MKTKLRELRQARGWTMEKVAAELRTGQPNLSRMERGLTRPQLPLMLRIARLYGLTTLDELVDVLGYDEAGDRRGAA